MKKLRVGVIYGGRSGEHEVSLASAAAVFKNLDPDHYEPVAIRIEKDGRWTLPRRPPTLVSAADVIGVLRATGELRSGAPAGYGAAHVFTLANGKVTGFREYVDLDKPLT